MKPIDETEHIRVLLKTGSMMTHEQKMGLVTRIRDNAIAAIVKLRLETITEGHDLTAPYQAYHFISELRKEAIPPELVANLDLLEACTRSVDNGQINGNAICAAYAKTDGDLIKGVKFKPRRKKGALSTKTKYINHLVSLHPGLSPKALYKIADKSILGKGRPLQISTFDKKVSEARNPK